jgi:hypothetical protein
MPFRKKIVEIPTQRMDASISASSARRDESGHLLIDVIWSTGAPVVRRPYWDEPYVEVLSMQAEHVDLSRFNNGAAALDSHGSWDLSDQIGAIVRGTAKVDGEKGTATIRLSKREEIKGIVEDIEAGIISKVSVGYQVRTFEETIAATDGKMRTLKAIDWMPYEVSFVSIPADDGAESRSGKDKEENNLKNECTIILKRREQMPPENPSSQTQPESKTREEILSEGREAERKYQSEIRALVSAAYLDESVASGFIDKKRSLEDVKTEVIALLANKDAGETRNINQTISVERDNEVETRRESIESAIMKRVDPKTELVKRGREFFGLSLVEMARKCLGRDGDGLSRSDVAARALMSSSDLPYILLNVASKSLLLGYQSAPRTFLPMARKTFHTDFKGVSRVRLDDNLALEKVLENGLIKQGSLSDSGENYKLASYGKQISLTRQMIINDDLDTFLRIVRMFGNNASDLESDVFWTEFETGLMADNKLIWHADHSNLIADATPLGEETLDALELKLANQAKANGSKMNILGKYLVVPRSLRNKARKLVSKVNPQDSSSVNVYENAFDIVSEVRLSNPYHHYLVADHNQIDTFEVAYLEGQEGVKIDQAIDFDSAGMKISALHDFGAECVGYKGVAKQTGAAEAE